MIRTIFKFCAACVALISPSIISAQLTTDLFKGGDGDGYSNSRDLASSCAPLSLALYGGGIENGSSSSSRINSTCNSSSLNIFSGGAKDGYAVGIKVNSDCYFSSLNLFSGGANDGYAVGIKVNSDCYFATAEILSIPDSACPGTQVTIVGTGLFGTNSVAFNGVNATSFNVNSTFSITATVPYGAGPGPITINGSGGLTTSPTSINILPVPDVTVNPPGPLNLCNGAPVLIGQSSVTSYVWSNGETTSSIEASVAGNYWVQVTATNGCVGVSDTVIVNPAIYPVAAFSAEQTTGFTAQFTNNSFDASSFSWDFGNGNTSVLENPQFTFSAEGTYPVTLIATNDCGNDTISFDVVIIISSVDPFSGTEVIISPNPFHDFLNLTVRMKEKEYLDLAIYDMLGKMVYTSTIRGETEKTVMVDCSKLANGVYYLKLSNRSGILSRKIIRS